MTERDEPASEFSIRRKAGKRHASIPIRPNLENLDAAIRDAKKDLEAVRPEFRELAEHGERFKGSETGRKGALRKLLERTFEDLRKKLGRPPTTPEFLDSLRAKAAEEFDDRPDTKRARIIDVDEGKNICWSYGGREKSITYKRLRNIRTELSKNFFVKGPGFR